MVLKTGSTIQAVELKIEKPEIKIKNDGKHFPKELATILSDAIVHCINNSLVHGLESPLDRKKAGKTARGSITIEIQREKSGLKIL